MGTPTHGNTERSTTFVRKSRVDWPAVLEQFRESGLSQKRFCEENGVPLSSLGYWLQKGRRSGKIANAAEHRFIELDLSSDTVATARGGQKPADVVVELPFGVVIRFRGVAR
jgi:hypothetical protein